MVKDDGDLEGLMADDEVGSEHEGWEDEAEDEDFGQLPRRPRRSPPKGSATIVDISGVHQIKVIPCVCKDQPLDMQYMDMGLFPASFKRVSTAFTFRVLEDQRLDHLECKTPLLKYWTKLRRKTSPDDWDSVPVCPCLLCCSV
jgi:KDZ transposase family protein